MSVQIVANASDRSGNTDSIYLFNWLSEKHQSIWGRTVHASGEADVRIGQTTSEKS